MADTSDSPSHAPHHPIMVAPPGTRGGVDLPVVYVLRRSHVEAALVCAPTHADGGVTLWIDDATVGIEKDCFHGQYVIEPLLFCRCHSLHACKLWFSFAADCSEHALQHSQARFLAQIVLFIGPLCT